MKKLLFLAFCLLPALGVHAIEFKVGNLNYVTNSDKTTVYVAHQSETLSGDLEIPESVTFDNKTYDVTAIGESAFAGYSTLTSVKMLSSVTKIGSKAFSGCTGLTTVEISDSVTSIGNYAFDGCSNLTTVQIPGKVTSIGKYAFYECKGMTTMSIPASVRLIDEYAFSGCRGLTSLTIAEGVTSIGRNAFYGCSGISSLIIPKSLSVIPYKGFQGCYNLTSLVISTGVKVIDRYAFSGCNLATINIPEGITSIGVEAFYGNRSLTTIAIPVSVSSIGEAAFAACTSVREFTVAVGQRRYSVVDGVLFEGNNWLVAYPNKRGTTYAIPTGVTTIVNSAFSDCVLLKSVTIPASVTTIGNSAFAGCTHLEKISCEKPTCPKVKSNIFSSVDTKKCVLTVPRGAYANYKNDDVWGDFDTIIENTNYDISTSTLGNGSVVCDSTTLQGGNSVTFSIKPNEGYIVSSATLNNKDITSEIVSNTYTVSKVYEDITFNVTFVLNEKESANTIYTQSFAVVPGSQMTIPVRMKNAKNITAFQFNMYLPGGLTFATEKNKNLITLSDRATKTHSIGSSIQEDGSMLVAAFSSKNSFFTGSDGELIYVTVNVPEDIASGDYTLYIKDVILIEDINNAHKTSVTASTISVASFGTGDSDGNGKVNILDAVNVVDYILHKKTSSFVFKASDIDNNGSINISDIVAALDAQMGVDTPTPSRSIGQEQSAVSDMFSMDPFYIKAGETKTLALRLNNTESYTAFQLDLVLPAGLTISKDAEGNDQIEMAGERSSESHVISSNEIETGKVRILGYSMNNALYKGNAGDFLYITLQADEAIESSKTEVKIENIHMVTANRNDNQLTALSGSVFLVNSITDLEEVGDNRFAVSVHNGILTIQSPLSIELPLYSVEGRLIRFLSVKEGINNFMDINEGLYIIKGVKVLVK